jgi:tetraacyldisaccharide-1-P 4'-kinase
VTGRINPPQVDNIYNKIYNNVSKSVPVLESKTVICGLYKCENNNFIPKNITDIAQKDVLAISGIGCPVAFKHLLEDQMNIKSIVQKIFPDHYRFSEKDVNIIYEKNKVDKKIIVITEKDYYRCVNDKTQHFIEKLNPYIIMTELKIINPDNSDLLLRDLCKKRV